MNCMLKATPCSNLMCCFSFEAPSWTKSHWGHCSNYTIEYLLILFTSIKQMTDALQRRQQTVSASMSFAPSNLSTLSISLDLVKELQFVGPFLWTGRLQLSQIYVLEESESVVDAALQFICLHIRLNLNIQIAWAYMLKTKRVVDLQKKWI